MMQASHAIPYAQSHNHSVLIKGWRSLSKRKGFRLKKILEYHYLTGPAQRSTILRASL